MNTSDATLKRPPALTIVALLFFLGGLSSILTEAAQSGGFRIPSWNLVNMIAGIGLLKCWRGWRGYALFITWTTLLFLLPFSVYAMMHPEWIVVKFPSILIDQRDHAVIPRLGLAVILTIAAALSVWVVRTLTRPDVRSLFQVQRT